MDNEKTEEKSESTESIENEIKVKSLFSQGLKKQCQPIQNNDLSKRKRIFSANNKTAMFVGILAAILMAVAQTLLMIGGVDPIVSTSIQIVAYFFWVSYFFLTIKAGLPNLGVEASVNMKMLACLNVLIFSVVAAALKEYPVTLLFAASLTFVISTLYTPKSHVDSFALSGSILLVSSSFEAILASTKGSSEEGPKNYNYISNVVAMVYLGISCYVAYQKANEREALSFNTANKIACEKEKENKTKREQTMSPAEVKIVQKDGDVLNVAFSSEFLHKLLGT